MKINKILHLGATLKTVDEDEKDLIIEGMASTVDKDRVGDVIEANAWRNGVTNFKKNPIILFNHNYNRPIGRATSVKQTEDGLAITAKISKAAGEIVELIKDGVLSTFSVGFMIKDADYDKDSDTFLIKKAELLEVSVVSVPANQSATFSVKKSLSEEEFNNLISGQSTVDKPNGKAASDTPEGPIAAKTQEKTMDPQEIQDMLKAALADASKEFAKQSALQRAEEKAAEEAAKKAAEEAAKKAAEEKERTTAVVKSMAEELVKDIKKDLEEREKSLAEVLEKYKGDLEAQSEELNKIRGQHKGIFHDRSNGKEFFKENEADIVEAHLLGVITRKGWGTSLGKQLVEKATNANTGVQAPSVTEENFETVVSTALERDIELELVLAPMFRTIQMNAASLVIPTMPDAGYAEFLATGSTAGTGASTAFRGNLESRDAASPGANSGIQLGSKVLTVAKLVSKSYIANETEEDAIIPILPLIRESLVRAHARAVEHSILLGQTTTYDLISSGYKGLTRLAVDDSKVLNMGSPAQNVPVTASHLLDLRQAMGKYGRRPGDVVYIVSLGAYYELLDDAEFQNLNEVGDRATKIRGEIGQVFGSAVVVCDEFPSEAEGAPFAVAVNSRNFVVPMLRGATVEQDYDVENQRRVLVATQRRGFDRIFTDAGQVVSYVY